MSFRAELTIEDRTYRVLSCTHTIHRDVDHTGRPSSRPRFGSITLEIESTEDISFWVNIGMGQPEGINGTVTFKKRDEEVRMKDLTFQNAFVIEHTESFYSEGSSPMSIRFTLSAKTLVMESSSQSCEIENEWPGAS